MQSPPRRYRHHRGRRRVRAVMEAVGVRDVLAKAIGTNNPHNVLRATIQGLVSLRSAEDVSALRGKKLEAPRK